MGQILHKLVLNVQLPVLLPTCDGTSSTVAGVVVVVMGVGGVVIVAATWQVVDCVQEGVNNLADLGLDSAVRRKIM